MNAWIHECMSSVDWLHSQTLRLQRFSVASVAIIVQIFPLIFGIDPQPPGGRPIGSNSPLVKRNKFRFDLKRERERERERGADEAVALPAVESPAEARGLTAVEAEAPERPGNFPPSGARSKFHRLMAIGSPNHDALENPTTHRRASQ